MDNDKELLKNDTKNTKKFPKFLMRFKWFRDMVATKKIGYGFPPFLPKTDETRIQNAPFYLLNKEPFVVAEKIDGQSGTFCLVRHKSKIPFAKDKFEYIVCSRNRRVFDENTSYWFVSKKYDIENVLHKLIEDYEWVAIQGECVAPKVQGNKYKVSEPDLYVFNLVYPDGRRGSVEAMHTIQRNNMKFVPIVNYKYTLPDTIQELLEDAHGKSELHDTLREGLVFRTLNGKHSFKAVDPLFLLKHNE